MKAFSPKDPAEIISLSFDVSKWLASGETITATTWSIAVLKGEDPAVGAMLVGIGTISGAVVSRLLQSGVAGVDYRLACLFDTSAGQKLKVSGVLPVRSL